MLEYLMRHPGRVLSKTMILSHVWGYSFDPGTNVVDVLVSRLRDKLDRGFDRKLIHTVRGAGYVLKAGLIASGRRSGCAWQRGTWAPSSSARCSSASSPTRCWRDRSRRVIAI